MMFNTIMYLFFATGIGIIILMFIPKDKKKKNEVQTDDIPGVNKLNKKNSEEAELYINDVSLEKALDIDTNKYGKVTIKKDGIDLIHRDVYSKIKQAKSAKNQYQVRNGLVYLVYKNHQEFFIEIEIAIEVLATLWQKEKEKEISLEELSLLYRNHQAIKEAENKPVVLELQNQILNDFYQKYIVNHIFYKDNYKNVIDEILIVLDKHGNCSSVPYGTMEKYEINDDDLKLLNQITLIEHSIDVCYELLKQIQDSKDDLMKNPVMYIIMIILGLSHDLGKMQYLFKQIGEKYGHYKASIFFLESSKYFSTLEQTMQQEIIDAVERHHDTRKLKEENMYLLMLLQADQSARRLELFKLQTEIANKEQQINKQKMNTNEPNESNEEKHHQGLEKSENNESTKTSETKNFINKNETVINDTTENIKKQMATETKPVVKENFSSSNTINIDINKEIEASIYLNKKSSTIDYILHPKHNFSGQKNEYILSSRAFESLSQHNILTAKIKDIENILYGGVDYKSFITNLFPILNTYEISSKNPVGTKKIIYPVLCIKDYIIFQVEMSQVYQVCQSAILDQSKLNLLNSIVNENITLKRLFYYLFFVALENNHECSVINYDKAPDFFYRGELQFENEDRILKPYFCIIHNLYQGESLKEIQKRLNIQNPFLEIVSIAIPEINVFWTKNKD